MGEIVKLVVSTIVLNGMPTLPAIFFNLNALTIDWAWHIAHGAADNVKDTSWNAAQSPGLSTDGTAEFLDMIRSHPRIKIYENELWPGKTAMCNACLADIDEPCVLLQCDADELFQPWQMEKIVELFASFPHHNRAYFWCRYFLGPNIITTSSDGYGNRNGMEWLRAWRYTPGQGWISHEPPNLDGNKGHALDRDYTKQYGLVFDHYAWAFPNQVQFKEHYYKYHDAYHLWQKLQQNTAWPITDLKAWLPWVGNGVSADRV